MIHLSKILPFALLALVLAGASLGSTGPLSATGATTTPPPPPPEEETRTSEDKGKTCRQRRQDAENKFRAGCLPAFQGMTTANNCTDWCAGNAHFDNATACGEQCTVCLGYLQAVEAEKGCPAK